jgi:seryl-tRNA synthetase
MGISKKYDIIDFELGNKIAGAGFPVYKGKGARQRALINYFRKYSRVIMKCKCLIW